MRIGYSHTLIERQKTHGQKLDGIGVYTQSLYRAMHALCPDLIPVNFAPLKQSFKPQHLFKRHYQPSPVICTMTPPVFNLYPELSKNLSVFHSTDYLIPRLKSTPVVATLHDAIMFKNPEYASGLRPLKNYILKRSVQHADHVITVSEAMVADIEKYWNIPKEKITAIHNGIDDIWFEPLSSEAIDDTQEKYHLKKPYILSVGTLQPRKNFSGLIKAYLNLPAHLQKQYDLIIVGKKGWHCEGIIQQLEKLKANHQGQWLSYVPFDHLRALYQGASVFAFASFQEGFGFPVIESFASKTAVLAANASSIPEIAQDAALLVKPDDNDEMTQGLQMLLESETLRQDLITKGAQRAQQFSWRDCAQKTFEVLKTVASH